MLEMKKRKETMYMGTDHSVFGGNIEIEDFNTSSPNKRRIDNQMEAVHFQETLEKEN